ncbi:hypothetical protein ACF3NG_02040 [Aerococcaceae bacterium WGS1372]
MFSHLHAHSIHIKLSPYNLTHHKIFNIIQSSLDLDASFIPTLSISYVMHVRHIHPDYGCLIFDHLGNIYRSQWTTSKLMRELFINQYGYDYDLWTKYIQSAYNKPRTVFPFVNKNHIYLRLKRDNSKHSDWLNLTQLVDCQISTIEDLTSKTSSQQINLRIAAQVNELNHFQSLTIQFTGNTKRILSQLYYGYQITTDWYAYLSTRSNSVSLRSFMNNPAFRFIINNGNLKQYRLPHKVDIDLFLKYVKVTNELRFSKNSSIETIIEKKELLHYIKENLFKYKSK